MNWKTEIQLIDLGSDQKLEATCTKCGFFHYPNVHALVTKQGMDMHYLDEVERELICLVRGCRGEMRIAIVSQGDTEGFIGGLA